MKRNLLVIIGIILIVGAFVTCGACAVGLKKSTKQQFTELNENMKGSREDVQGLTEQLIILNAYLADLAGIKTLATSPETLEQLKEFTETMKRIADALEALNGKAGKLVGEDAELPFYLVK